VGKLEKENKLLVLFFKDAKQGKVRKKNIGLPLMTLTCLVE